MSRPPVKRAAALLWFAMFLAVVLTTGRLHIRGDASQMCAVAAALGDHGWFNIPRTRGDVVEGPDGKGYSKYPLLTVLQCAPALWCKSLGKAIDGPDTPTEWLLTGVVPAAVTATCAVFFLLVAFELGFSLSIGAIGAILMVFTTPIWSHGRELYSENLQAALLLALLWTALVAGRTDQRRWLLLGGVLCGLLLIAKFPMGAVPAFVALMFAVDGATGRRWLRFLWCGALGALPFLIAFFAYNHLRFGGILEQGYADPRTEHLGFGTPLHAGLHGLLFSSGKSVFLYAPLLFLSLLGLRPLYRRHPGAIAFSGAVSAFLFLLMAKWWSGLGDWGWGPRLVVPVLPLLLLPALEVFAHPSALRRASVMVLSAAGFVVNFLGIVIDHSHYLWVVSEITQRGLQLHRAGGLVRDDLAIIHFIPEFSPILGHYWLLDVFFSGWYPDHWTPWESMNIPAWGVTRDPTPPFLNHWSDGSPLAWLVIALGWSAVLLLVVGLAVLLRPKPVPNH